jgi:ABC-type bacteriocin/lantibiotic exporter with double-glycine peptidase domain
MDALDRIRVERSCLIVTHQMEMTERADHIVVLRQGQLQPQILVGDVDQESLR